MGFEKLFQKLRKERDEAQTRGIVYFEDPTYFRYPLETFDAQSTTQAMRLSAVSACVEIRSDSVGKMPFYVKNREDKVIDIEHPLSRLLRVRPNRNMTPYTFKKLLETWRLLKGNAYVYLARDEQNGLITDLIPLSPDYVEPFSDDDGRLWYRYSKGTMQRLIDDESVIHLKGFTDDGVIGTSVLSRAALKLKTLYEQERYQNRFYSNNARPSGAIVVDSDLSTEAKDEIRKEWQRVYGGVDNAFKVAVLDHGMDYRTVSLSQSDAQFLETVEASIADIARYFLVPLYKLQAGKQTYQSNEQNAIEYVTTALAPTIKQYEEEFTYKCLFAKEIEEGKEVVINLNAEMRGDSTTRSQWFKTMREIGAYSVNDIRRLEDLPDVPGGDIRIAPLNNISLERMDEYFQSLMQKDDVGQDNRLKANAAQEDESKENSDRKEEE